MAVHCLRVTVSTVDPNGDPVDLQEKKATVQNWVDNHDEVLQTESEEFQTGTTGVYDDGVDFAQGSWRFAWAEDPMGMKDQIASWLSNNFQWWAVAYHQCDHDVDGESNCQWDNQWTHGNPPAEVLAAV